MTREEIISFLTIVECGSISGAAQKLYMGQSTLSAQLKSLETELDCVLLRRKRGGKGVEITVAGHNFELYARRWLRLWDDTRKAVRETSPRSVHIVTSYTMSYIIPYVYLRLSEETRSATQFTFSSHHYNELYHILEHGEADLGFASSTRYSRDVRTIPLYRESIVVLVNEKSDLPSELDPSLLTLSNEIYIPGDSDFVRWHTYYIGPPTDASVQAADYAFVETALRFADDWALVPVTIANALCIRNPSLRYCTIKGENIYRTSRFLIRGDADQYGFVPEMFSRLHEFVTRLGAEWILED